MNKSGTKINYSRQRYPWEPPYIPEYEQEFPQLAPVPKVIEFPDVKAKFPGGEEALEKWIDSNIVRPNFMMDEKPYKIYIAFTVQRDGSITDIKILRGLNAEIDREVKRLIRLMPKWEPAIYQGEVCTSKLRMPIAFELK